MDTYVNHNIGQNPFVIRLKPSGKIYLKDHQFELEVDEIEIYPSDTLKFDGYHAYPFFKWHNVMPSLPGSHPSKKKRTSMHDNCLTEAEFIQLVNRKLTEKQAAVMEKFFPTFKDYYQPKTH